MAHQAHNIPWQVLAANLKPVFRKYDGADRDNFKSNFYLRSKPQQAKELNYFVKAFAKNIQDHTRCEREKYEETYLQPAPSDVLLSDDIVKKIHPTVLRVRERTFEGALTNAYEAVGLKNSTGSLCCHEYSEPGFRCRCAMPRKERNVAAFLRRYRYNSCYNFLNVNAEAFYNLEVVKILLLHGAMDIILRICTHPDVDYRSWHRVGPCYDSNEDAGWDCIYLNAIDMYICLNICYCFPQTWESEPGRNATHDYRNTRLYQMALLECTSFDTTSIVPGLPHRQFFGISDETYDAQRSLRRKRDWPLRGVELWQDCLATEGLTPDPVVLDSFTINYTGKVLKNKGLPAELVWNILGYIEPGPRNRLAKPLDPFHPANSQKLRRYLTYCWQLIIRCNMMAAALGMKLKWEEILTGRLTRLLSSDFKWYRYVICSGGDHYEFV